MSEVEKLQLNKEADELKAWWESDAPNANLTESVMIFIEKSRELKSRYTEEFILCK